jgi:hypothetical protein
MCDHTPNRHPGYGSAARKDSSLVELSSSRGNYSQVQLLSQACEECKAKSAEARRCNPVWEMCACGVDRTDVEERMKAFKWDQRDELASESGAKEGGSERRGRAP